MTLRAWMVFGDCKYARSLFHTPCVDKQWRYQWFATVALLRSIGYVLKNIDAQTSPKHKAVIDGEYRRLQDTRPTPEIFWEFIDRERHLVVKEYLFSDPILGGAGVSAFCYTDPDTGKLETFQVDQTGGRFEVYSKHFRDGHFKGRAKLDVVDEAIAWWVAFLRSLESQIGSP